MRKIKMWQKVWQIGAATFFRQEKSPQISDLRASIWGGRWDLNRFSRISGGFRFRKSLIFRNCVPLVAPCFNPKCGKSVAAKKLPHFLSVPSSDHRGQIRSRTDPSNTDGEYCDSASLSDLASTPETAILSMWVQMFSLEPTFTTHVPGADKSGTQRVDTESLRGRSSENITAKRLIGWLMVILASMRASTAVSSTHADDRIETISGCLTPPSLEGTETRPFTRHRRSHSSGESGSSIKGPVLDRSGVVIIEGDYIPASHVWAYESAKPMDRSWADIE